MPQVTNKHAELINEVDVLKNEADAGRREMSNRADNIRDREIFQVEKKVEIVYS